MAGQYIFISYSHRDDDFVRRLSRDLLTAGIGVWIDFDGLKPGMKNFETEIRTAIENAYAVVHVATPFAKASTYVQGELELAARSAKPIIVLWHDGEWEESVPIDLIKSQYLDFRADAYKVPLGDLIKRLRELEGAREPDAASYPLINPYPGLRPFQGEDHVFFFGRDRLINQIIADLGSLLTGNQDEPALRFMPIVGASGSGKSSLIRAGLLPRLQEGRLGGKWLTLPPITPSAHPLDKLEAIFANALSLSGSQVRDDLLRTDRPGLQVLGERLRGLHRRQILLFVDQFEELFTTTQSEEERRQFARLLADAAKEPFGACVVIAAMRSDFIDQALAVDDLASIFEGNLKYVRPLNDDEAREAIEKPAVLVGLRLEAGLSDVIISELGDPQSRTGMLPSLQFTLEALYNHRLDRTLTLDTYRQIGGVQGALSRYAASVYNGLSPDQQDLARSLFLNLIILNAEGQGIKPARRPLEKTSLVKTDGLEAEALQPVIDAFLQAGLLYSDREGEDEFIYLSHEALTIHWKTYAEWIETYRGDALLAQQIRHDASVWKGRGSKPDDKRLYQGDDLAQASAWLTRQSAVETASVQFVTDSEKAEQARIAAEAKRVIDQQRNRRILEVVAAIFIVAIAGLIIYLFVAESARREQELLLNLVNLSTTRAVGSNFYDQRNAEAAHNYYQVAVDGLERLSAGNVDKFNAPPYWEIVEPAAWYGNLGLACAQLENYDCAERHLAEALRLDPTYLDTFLIRAFIAERQGDEERMQESIRALYRTVFNDEAAASIEDVCDPNVFDTALNQQNPDGQRALFEVLNLSRLCARSAYRQGNYVAIEAILTPIYNTIAAVEEIDTAYKADMLSFLARSSGERGRTTQVERRVCQYREHMLQDPPTVNLLWSNELYDQFRNDFADIVCST